MKDAITIGVLIGGTANSPYTLSLMQGIHHATQQLKINALYFLGIHSSFYNQLASAEPTEEDFDYQFNIVPDYAGLGNVDALIISYGTLCVYLGSNDKSEYLKKYQNIPYVLLGEKDDTGRGCSIVVDNYGGMYELVEHLVRDHGYREFTFLSGPRSNSDASERKRAVFDVMKRYGIPFSEERVAYGDYSKEVEDQVNDLLDRYPGMEAMICANDLMADTAYRECEKRGLVVGRDIAITGYDDWEIAESMNPPLTTVLQNSYDMGYMAAMSAYELIQGSAPKSVVVPAQVKYRASCGCRILEKAPFENGVSAPDGQDRFVDYLMNKILLANLNEIIRRRLRSCAEKLLREDFTDPARKRQILTDVEELLAQGEDKYLSSNALMRVLNEYINALIRGEMTPEGTQTLLELKDDIQDTILSHTIKSQNDKYAGYEQETWSLPLISRQMMNHIDDEQEFYRMAMVKLSAMRVRSSYLYVFQDPVPHLKDEVWQCPEKMYLAAYQVGDKVKAFSREDRPVLTKEKGIADYCAKDGIFNMSVFCLFAGKMQYGILVMEIDTSEMALSYLISMQVANALRFFELSTEQRRTRRKLEMLVKEINEKNEVLNFISENDALTGCLNRRGFMEQAVALNRENVGKQAYMLFADLDHLKEINDRFGHLEGDFAIRHCASAIRQAVGDRGIVARIGGDEFVAFAVGETAREAEEIIAATKEINRRFNEGSDKDYYVEVSMGYQELICRENASLTEVLAQADRALYEAKKKRRKTICKFTEEAETP